MVAVVNIDGLAMPNPGLGTYGYVIRIGGRDKIERCGLAGRRVTNNYAEYAALEKALEEVASLGEREVIVKSDSRLLVGQMGMGWKVKKGGYVEMYKKAKDMVKKFESVKFEWVPREKNEEADMLTNIALKDLRS
ncbi:MAG TPA: ribonuclease HI family protein [Nitrososphaerales archaeon]|nr:ribonuclease HI family protein [Nitrososphaerales archaeon]